ncbi:hypothetical protein QF023_003271 [Chryseobacterium sp. SLBN-27]|nr:hypothetical protein [Chryseobacterium sp. SLBN-27]
MLKVCKILDGYLILTIRLSLKKIEIISGSIQRRIFLKDYLN